MPLQFCRLDETDGDARETYLVLTGAYCVGTLSRIANGSSRGDWAWAMSFGHGLDEGGTVGTLTEAKDAIRAAFRKQLARIGLAEAEGQRAPQAARELATASEAHWDVPRSGQTDDAEQSPRGYPRIARITSGDLPVGVLREVEARSRHWTWVISGTRHQPSNFVWNGWASSLEEGQDALLHAWSTWLAWAGLRQVRAPEMSSPIRPLC
jgi:hypothetical protein